MTSLATASALLHSASSPAYPPLLSRTGLAFPRSRISEIFGPPSSGRTSLLWNVLEQATAGDQESCAYIDAGDGFDPVSAAAAGVILHRLLWVRCGGNTAHAMKTADLVLQAGGFGVVVIDLANASLDQTRRIPPNYWYRFRHAVEHSRTALLVLAEEPQVRQCAALSIESRRVEAHWTGQAGCSLLLDGVRLQFQGRKPAHVSAVLEARARV